MQLSRCSSSAALDVIFVVKVLVDADLVDPDGENETLRAKKTSEMSQADIQRSRNWKAEFRACAASVVIEWILHPGLVLRLPGKVDDGDLMSFLVFTPCI